MSFAFATQFFWSCKAQTQSPKPVERMAVGAEVFLSGDCSDAVTGLVSKRQRLAVVGNQSSLVGDTHLVDALVARGFNVVKIFCPEHGFRGDAEAGAAISNGRDAGTGIPIVSLYGKNKKPTASQLSDVDVVVFDLQDVGCRFYTYISTLHYVMEACAEQNLPCIVLDRPNPNCHYVDGPVLESKYRSFIGMHPVPVVYGLTIGEYATMINGEKWLNDGVVCRLEVVPMRNYRRDSLYPLPIAPSPNLQTPHSIALYPSLCLFEGTNISVGRGTATPFEIIGSPEYSSETNCPYAPAIEFTPHSIKGVSNNPPFKDKLCKGLDLRNVSVQPKFDITWLLWMYKQIPHDTFFKDSGFFELLAGNGQLRLQMKQGLSEEEIRASWEPQLSRYKEIRKKYLIYQP